MDLFGAISKVERAIKDLPKEAKVKVLQISLSFVESNDQSDLTVVSEAQPEG